jgi:acyl carrier protein
MQTVSGVENWLLDWFGKRTNVLGSNREQIIQMNYFDAKLIDSLQVMELIAELEEHFSIQFTEDHFQERRFATIKGLSQIVCELTESPVHREAAGDR